MDDDDVPDTRVYVSGLPPNFTNEQLGAHFAMRYQITDAVVVPGRRIGFVGFRNYTLAKNAVKYFDKSYIRLSKIAVEIAKPIKLGRDASSQAAPVSRNATEDHSQPSTSTQSAHRGGASAKASSFQPYVPLDTTSTSNKRKREDVSRENQEGFNVFMDTMQTSGAKATWSNGTDTTAVTATGGQQSPPTVEIARTADGSLKKQEKKDKKTKKAQKTDSETAPQDEANVAKKQKKKKPTPLEATDTAIPSNSADALLKNKDISQSGEEVKRKGKKERERAAADSGGHEIESRAGPEVSTFCAPKTKKKRSKSSADAKGGVGSLDDASGLDNQDADRAQLDDLRNDNDWLRARTNRVLDLVGDAKVEAPASASTAPAGSASSDVSSNDSQNDAEPHIATLSSVVQHDLENSLTNGRLFLRNVPYSASEADIDDLFSKYGKVNEVHIVQDARASIRKGLAYVQYGDPSSAAHALQKLDGLSFQGRLLHILPAFDKKSQKLNEYEISKLPLKRQNEIKRKRDAVTSTFSWNSLYMNPDAVLSSVADRLGVSKAELLDPTSSDAAVKQAHAETHVIQETIAYLASKGVKIDAFQNLPRDDRTLLVKNFPFGVTTDDLRQLLEMYGHICQLLMPPTGTIAIVQFSEASEASNALKQLAYKNLQGSVLFLEKGPRGLFDQQVSPEVREAKPSTRVQHSVQASGDAPDSRVGTASSTVFVRNLNFATTTARLEEAFEPLTGFLSAMVKLKTDPKRPGEVLSMGFGFVDFRTSREAQAAISVMNGHKLDNHELVVEASHRAADAAEERRRDDIGKKLGAKKTKVIIKNLPFEASKKDIRSLFGAYGQLRSVRVPKKFDNSTRGFAFADFVSAKEAENAVAALANTHLLGRRLVLEFATGDAIDPEDEIRAMEQRVSQQTTTVNMSKLTGTGRRKFAVDARDGKDA